MVPAGLLFLLGAATAPRFLERREMVKENQQKRCQRRRPTARFCAKRR
jgi:hypothetical protein